MCEDSEKKESEVTWRYK